jgi:hypothetical protein
MVATSDMERVVAMSTEGAMVAKGGWLLESEEYVPITRS